MFSKTSERLVIGTLAIAAIVATAIAVVVVLHTDGAGLFESRNSMSSIDAGKQPQPPQLPAMQLQQQFSGPLLGTAIQRWRDPIDGTICYIFLPMVVHHTSAPLGYVQYGSNSIGSISCLAAAGQALPGTGQQAPR
ncbi:MAG: hypothetical protein WAM62_04090 [Pseudolabrys sp.]